MEVRILKSIQDIDQREWEYLVGTEDVERSYGWYRAVEESGMRELTYVTIQEGGALLAAACCSPIREPIFSTRVAFLEVRSPLGVTSAFHSPSPEHTHQLLDTLLEIQRTTRTRGMLVLELTRDEFSWLGPQMKGFVGFPLADDTYLDLPYKDFDDYLASLDPTTRRSARITMNRAAKKWNLRTIFTNDFLKWKDTAHRLQRYTCQSHKDPRWLLTESFYEGLENHLKDRAELAICLKEDMPIACALWLNSGGTVHIKYPGIDPGYRECHAYFLLYYETIREALQRGQKRIYFGVSTYEFKERIGCKRQNAYGFAKVRNPLLHAAVYPCIFLYRILGKTF
ncbi:MAG: GNAT family N-acetyltransferase [Theionarchaea archaeon]|nr:GNAT family N-acetyltransferase [Theionarchaea archaeon]MBU7000104.1 GNAT family N-acetyltransferase [Theionarchaea archaeon]MBU7020821.1 GNAT family N-acetyltransferase [Theionarchaea archaeon]MBU7033943.1 GNAT family N-acetyltransferase [Theionarchaea archaeon]MBU7039239.1 GNAT family N-acetyltransferase [Theionarchaea archaeon]